MAKIIALVNIRGGTGRTATTINLGKALSIFGKNTLLIDMSYNINLSLGLDYDNEKEGIYDVLCNTKKTPIIQVGKNYSLIASNLTPIIKKIGLLEKSLTYQEQLKEALSPYTSKYDYILIDCSSDLSLLTINALVFATDILFVASSMQHTCISDLSRLFDFCKEMIVPINSQPNFLGISFTQFSNTNHEKNIIQDVKKVYADKIFNSIIRKNTKLPESTFHKKDIFAYAPQSSVAQDYMLLTKEILNIT